MYGLRKRTDQRLVSAQKPTVFRGRSMPVVTCPCGFELLVVPDLTAMDKALKNHVAGHKLADSEKVMRCLTERVLVLVCKKDYSILA
jgi:hypothetical protein